MFTHIKMDVEYNDTTPAISVSLCYKDSDMSAENEIIIPENIKHIYIHHENVILDMCIYITMDVE